MEAFQPWRTHSAARIERDHGLRPPENAYLNPLPTLSVEAAIESQLKKLSARSRHVSFLLGAGASKACGLPTIGELVELVKADLQGLHKAAKDYAFDANANLEEGLSRLRRLRTVLRDGAKVAELDVEAVERLDHAICASIVKHLAIEGKFEPYRRLAAWLNGQQYLKPVELFTVNYDLLLEAALEQEKVHYFDGFVGAIKAAFRSDLVEILNDPTRSLPPSCSRVWKLHGSLNWKVIGDGAARRVVRTGAVATDAIAIFPSEEKYEDSRRVPFVVLMDRLRHALQEKESFTIICGYSFGDQHLNEILFDAARLYPRSELWVLCHADIPDAVKSQAALYPNIVAHGSDQAIAGGREYKWAASDAKYFDGNSCRLGDFDVLTQVLLPEGPKVDG